MTSLILPSANTEMMGLFLSHVSSTYAKYFVVMQVDQASWHVTKDLKIPVVEPTQAAVAMAIGRIRLGWGQSLR